MHNRKKMVLLALALAMTMSASACSVKSAKEVNEEANQSTTETAAFYNIGEKVNGDGYEFTVHNIRRYDEGGTGHCYILVNVTYTNTSSEKVTVNTNSDILCYLDNEQAEMVAYYDNPDVINDNLLFGNSVQINPGRSKTGDIVYVFYRSWNSIEIQCKDLLVSGTYRDVDDIIIEETVPPTATPTPRPTPIETSTTETVPVA